MTVHVSPKVYTDTVCINYRVVDVGEKCRETRWYISLKTAAKITTWNLEGTLSEYSITVTYSKFYVEFSTPKILKLRAV